MATKFEPLTLDMVEEGNFLGQIQTDFARLQESMIKYAKKHGVRSRKSKGKLTITLDLICTEPNGLVYDIVGSTKLTMPNAPASVTTAIGDEGQDERDTLFVRSSGSSAAHPAQNVLSTQDGRPVIDGEPKKPLPANSMIVDGHVVDKVTGQDYGPCGDFLTK